MNPDHLIGAALFIGGVLVYLFALALCRTAGRPAPTPDPIDVANAAHAEYDLAADLADVQALVYVTDLPESMRAER